MIRKNLKVSVCVLLSICPFTPSQAGNCPQTAGNPHRGAGLASWPAGARHCSCSLVAYIQQSRYNKPMCQPLLFTQHYVDGTSKPKTVTLRRLGQPLLAGDLRPQTTPQQQSALDAQAIITGHHHPQPSPSKQQSLDHCVRPPAVDTANNRFTGHHTQTCHLMYYN